VAADARLAGEAASRGRVQLWDSDLGGFGQAPKFPQAMTIDFLLAHHLRTGDTAALDAAAHSLDAMSRGGIYDHVDGGFARYSVDAAGWSPTSRRCSTTTRCCCAPTRTRRR
jgi:uncharacterized protein